MRNAVRIAAGLLFVIMACLAFPAERPSVGERFVVGEVQKEDVIAPFDFKILKDDDGVPARTNRSGRRGAPVFDATRTPRGA